MEKEEKMMEDRGVQKKVMNGDNVRSCGTCGEMCLAGEKGGSAEVSCSGIEKESFGFLG
jgi:hypothetical protein